MLNNNKSKHTFSYSSVKNTQMKRSESCPPTLSGEITTQPAGWSMRLWQNGNPYFVHRDTQFTQDKKPTPGQSTSSCYGSHIQIGPEFEHEHDYGCLQLASSSPPLCSSQSSPVYSPSSPIYSKRKRDWVEAEMEAEAEAEAEMEAEAEAKAKEETKRPCHQEDRIGEGIALYADMDEETRVAFLRRLLQCA